MQVRLAMASGKKRKRSEASVLGVGSSQLSVLSSASFGIVASFVDRTDIRSMSCVNHAAFDQLQENRVKRRAEFDDSMNDMINPNFADASARLRYYNCIESFTYQFLLGQLVLETGESDFADSLSILHGPVLEHLLTLCGSNLQLARNVVANYLHFFKVTSHLQDVPNSLWLTDRPQMRMDESLETRWEKWNDNCFASYFNKYFQKRAFPGLDAYAYVQYLIRESDEVFKMIECTLSLRMRAADGKCELGACGTLLDDMHMTTTVHDFVAHLRTIHTESVQQHIAVREHEDAVFRAAHSGAYVVDNERYNGRPLPDEGDIADVLYWYDEIAPNGMYLYDESESYVDLGYRSY
jgi:hypothetical protein